MRKDRAQSIASSKEGEQKDVIEGLPSVKKESLYVFVAAEDLLILRKQK